MQDMNSTPHQTTQQNQKSDKPVLCIYHANCADGFASALIVNEYFKNVKKQPVEFHEGVYQQPPPDVTGRNVIMVDFSYKRPVLLEMAMAANHILILDHHKTAEEDLTNLPINISTYFDMSRSGAMITWNYFYPLERDGAAPEVLKRIQDRDLWKFDYPDTRAVQANLFSYPYNFNTWRQLVLETPVEKLAQEGWAILRKHEKDVRELLKQTEIIKPISGYEVPVANLPYMYSSDAAHIMAVGNGTEDNPQYPFAACYFLAKDGYRFSLRSANGGIDVSEIAKKYGGGGHEHAAGFTVESLGIPENL